MSRSPHSPHAALTGRRAQVHMQAQCTGPCVVSSRDGSAADHPRGSQRLIILGGWAGGSGGPCRAVPHRTTSCRIYNMAAPRPLGGALIGVVIS